MDEPLGAKGVIEREVQREGGQLGKQSGEQGGNLVGGGGSVGSELGAEGIEKVIQGDREVSFEGNPLLCPATRSSLPLSLSSLVLHSPLTCFPHTCSPAVSKY